MISRSSNMSIHQPTLRKRMAATFSILATSSSLLPTNALIPPPHFPSVHQSALPRTTALHQTQTLSTTSTPTAQSTQSSQSTTEQLNTYPPLPSSLLQTFTPQEWTQRCSLAVSYRIAYLHDWHENIFNHITLKVEGSDGEPDGPHFLLNDFGIGFDEITASNLLKVNLDGKVVEPREPMTPLEPLGAGRRELGLDYPGKGRVFKPGYVLHSAIHAARTDVHAIWHGHDLDASAVSQTKFGLLPLSQEATYVLNKGLSYHPFEGSANDLSEQPRLVKNLGPKNQMLMLEDHGPIVACPTIEEAFAGMYFLTRACKYQIKALGAVGGDLEKIHMPDEGTLEEMVRRMERFDEAPKEEGGAVSGGEEEGRVEEGGQQDKGEEVVHDTPGLMFAYARRTAERVFGKDSIYR